MIKTVSINLGGLVFQVNEDAFATLQSYIEDLKKYYQNEEGGEEIVDDIESRFAELFSEKLYANGREVVTSDDVLSVIRLMGKPHEFDNEDDRSSFNKDNDQKIYENDSDGNRKLFRDKDSAVISGVCAGLSNYFGISDPIWVRLIFIAIVLLGGSGILIYLVAWLIIPEAKTASDKLRMHGKPVNITNLESRIKDEMFDAGNNFREFVQGDNSSGNNVLAKAVNGIGKVFGVVLSLCWFFGKLLLGFIAISLIVALGVTLVGLVLGVFSAIPWASANIISESWVNLTGGLGALLLAGIPILALMYIPIRMFSNFRIKNNRVIFIAAGLWLTGIILSSVTANTVMNYFSEDEIISSEEYITGIHSDTLILKINGDYDDGKLSSRNFYKKGYIQLGFDKWTASWLDLDVRQSSDDGIYIEKTLYASGKNKKTAKANAEAIDYNYELKGNVLTFDPALNFGKGRRWRQQSVSLNLLVPEGTVLIIENDMEQILDDVPNSLNLDAHYIAGSDWKMSNKKLIPTDSSWTVDKIYSNVSSLREMNVSNFNEIDISGSFDVEIMQSEQFKVLISDLIDDDLIDFKMEGNKMNISWKKDQKIFKKLNSWKEPKIFIEMPILNELSIGGASDCKLKYFEQENMKLIIKGASELDANIVVQQLECILSGASSLDLKGDAVNASMKLLGASEVDAEDFFMEILSIDMVGASEADVNVSKEINGKIIGASSLYYKGDPNIDVRSLGASEVVNEN